MSSGHVSEFSELAAVVNQLSARLAELEEKKARAAGAADGGAGGDGVEAGGGSKDAEGGVVESVVASVGGVGDVAEKGRGKMKLQFGDAVIAEGGVFRPVGDTGETLGGSGSEGSVSSGASDRSWADAVEDEKPLGPCCQPLVGSGEARGATTSNTVGGKRFFKEFVRTARTRAYVRFIREKFGFEVPAAAMQELALVSYATGTVPDAFVNGKHRIVSWAAIGDAAMSLVTVDALASAGQAVAAVQAVRSTALSNAKLSAACVEVGIAAHVAFPPGVNAGTAKSGADAYEALCGVLFRYMGLQAVHRVLVVTGLILPK